MAMRSPKSPVICEKYDVGCTWRLYRIFHFREGPSKRKLLSSKRHLDSHIGNGNERHKLDVDSKSSDKDRPIDVHPKRGRGYGCKSISCVNHGKVDEIFTQYQRNEAIATNLNQKFIDGNDMGKDGAGPQSKQLLDALQILYSNKELFVKILKDPNSLLVKQIHQQARKQLTRSVSQSRLTEHQKSNARHFENPSSYNCDPQSANRIVVLEPGPDKVQNSADIIHQWPSLHSHNSSSYNGKAFKPSFFSFGHLKRKLKDAMGTRRKVQHSVLIDGEPHKAPCGCQALVGSRKVSGAEIFGRDWPSKVKFGIAKEGKSSLDVKNTDKINKAQDSEYLQQNELNISVEARRNHSEMLNNRGEDSKHLTNNQEKTIFSPEYDCLSRSSGGYPEHGFVADQMRYSPYGSYQLGHGIKWGLQRQRENVYLNSLKQNREDSPGADIRKLNDQLHVVGTNVDITKNLFPNIPEGFGKLMETKNSMHQGEIYCLEVPSEPDSRQETGPTLSSDMADSSEGIGYFLDSTLENQLTAFSAVVSSLSPSSVQRMEDSNSIEQPRLESVLEQFIVDVVSPAGSISRPGTAESPVRVLQDNFDEHKSAGGLRSPPDSMDNLNTLQFIREVLQASGLSCDEPSMECYSSKQLLNPSLQNELKKMTDQFGGNYRILFDCINEVLVEVYHCYFRCSPWVSIIKPNVQTLALKRGDKTSVVDEVTKRVERHFFQQPPTRTFEQLAEMDLRRCGTWLDIGIDTEDIVIEVEGEVIEDLIMDSISEMHIGSMINC
ncbi:Phosphatidylinositol N-acetyglucosaminlytransferase subunit P-like protein [Quillaja saponaria]|uniref:Phosphatidylinositol N-acetyglucosaminlytransferase subunit P-like protein n=1 Tax=Quillaja saponaria TaxID=32244 RepID=A0AAD7L656_QUISA|nr:Phosphatidylinositol N-acetyglucosaminlytransferase subunit P-like protein [Quillaja saponaria]